MVAVVGHGDQDGEKDGDGNVIVHGGGLEWLWVVSVALADEEDDAVK